MSCIVAKISEEVEKIFEDLTADASISISDVEDQVSGAVASWGTKALRGDPL